MDTKGLFKVGQYKPDRITPGQKEYLGFLAKHTGREDVLDDIDYMTVEEASVAIDELREELEAEADLVSELKGRS